MAQAATATPSAAHRAVLRALQDILAKATRSDRVLLAQRIDNLRTLVISARGIGAEQALARLLDSRTTLALDELELLLNSRASHNKPAGQTRLIAMLCCGQVEQDGVLAFLHV